MLPSNFWKKYFKVYDLLNELIPYQELLAKIVDEADIKQGDLVLENYVSVTGVFFITITA